MKKSIYLIYIMLFSTAFIFPDSESKIITDSDDYYARIERAKQSSEKGENLVLTDEAAPDNDEEKDLLNTWYNNFLPKAAIVFGIIILLYMTIIFIIVLRGEGIQSQMFNLLLLSLIFICSVFLLIIGYSKAEITPVIGLFGTAIGYMFGKNSKDDSAQNENPKGQSVVDD